jgi:hypothetical protein
MVVAAYDVVIADDHRIVPAVLSNRLRTGIWDGTEILKEFLRGKLSALALSSIMRTDLLRLNGGFSSDHPHCGDLAAWAPLLLRGRAGLVNERCASYTMSNSRTTTQLDVDCRFLDIIAVTGEIFNKAGQMIVDETARRDVQNLTKRYLAYKAIESLVVYRHEGASLTDALRRLWSWRKRLIECTFTDFISSARPRSVASVLLSRSTIQLLRRFGIR